ncbi:hypothetical protein [Streptomyces sp. DW26H14]
MPLDPTPVQPVIDPAAADLGTMVDLGLVPEQPEPPDPDVPSDDPPQDGS